MRRERKLSGIMNGARLRRIVPTTVFCLVAGVVIGSTAAAQSPPPTQPASSTNSPSARPNADPASAEIQKAVDDAIRERLRDSKVVEVETSQAIVTRLSDWAKLFGFFIGIPLALFAAWLGVVGFKSYKDVKAVIDRARDDVTRTFDKAREDANAAADAANKTAAEVREIRATLQAEAEKLRTKLQEVGALVPQVQELSQRVASIENVVKFKASKTLTPELKQHLSQTLQRYYDYLKSVGLSLKLRPPTVVVDSKDLNASYSPPPKNQIVVHPELIEYPDVALREFTHYVMGEIRPEFDWRKDVAGLESGFGDYLPASFIGDPDFGKDIWPIFERHFAGFKVPNRNLKHQRAFSEVVLDQDHQHSNGNIWGGAWWELREALGRETFDTLLMAAWKSCRIADATTQLSVFPLELMKQDRTLNAGKHERAIRRVFESRGQSLSRAT